MKEVSIVGLDLAKRVFQVHASRSDGSLVLRRKLSRGQVVTFFTDLPKMHGCDGDLRHRALLGA
nr:IS110 family transposase [Rhizobium sp. Khangiran2]